MSTSEALVKVYPKLCNLVEPWWWWWLVCGGGGWGGGGGGWGVGGGGWGVVVVVVLTPLLMTYLSMTHYECT